MFLMTVGGGGGGGVRNGDNDTCGGCIGGNCDSGCDTIGRSGDSDSGSSDSVGKFGGNSGTVVTGGHDQHVYSSGSDRRRGCEKVW